jgi:hypothetical protein
MRGIETTERQKSARFKCSAVARVPIGFRSTVDKTFVFVWIEPRFEKKQKVNSCRLRLECMVNGISRTILFVLIAVSVVAFQQ